MLTQLRATWHGVLKLVQGMEIDTQDGSSKEVDAMGALKGKPFYMKIFEGMDVDQSGEIDKEEMKVAMKSLGLSPSDGEIDELFDKFDTDRSGSIELVEFHTMLLELMPTSFMRCMADRDRAAEDGGRAQGQAHTEQPQRKEDADPGAM